MLHSLDVHSLQAEAGCVYTQLLPFRPRGCTKFRGHPTGAGVVGFVTARDLKTLVQSPSLILLSHGGPEQKGTQDLQSASVLGDPIPSCQAGTWSPQADGAPEAAWPSWAGLRVGSVETPCLRARARHVGRRHCGSRVARGPALLTGSHLGLTPWPGDPTSGLHIPT